MNTSTKQQETTLEKINQKNARFWNELCGSTLAKSLKIDDRSPKSLEKYDSWYLHFYPYLLSYVNPSELKGKKVLEIGLGYGTLGQKIAESGAEYTGFDIAEGPVEMMNHRLNGLNLPQTAKQGNFLECSFDANTFDHVVAIGCFHHTGNTQKCIDQTYRILKPGGKATLMVYNQYSATKWVKWPFHLLKNSLSEKGIIKSTPSVSETMRGQYDLNTSGDAAPETAFMSKDQLKKMCSKFSKVKLQTENSHKVRILKLFTLPRNFCLRTIGRMAGTDIYIQLTK